MEAGVKRRNPLAFLKVNVMDDYLGSIVNEYSLISSLFK